MTMEPTDDQRRDEAADWFAAMRDPEAASQRAAFETWLSDPQNRIAYNRIAEVYSLGKMLGEEDMPPPEDRPRPRHRSLAILAVIVAIALGGWMLAGMADSLQPPANEEVTEATRNPSSARISAAKGAIRIVRLADGSELTLDSDTIVTTVFSDDRRIIRLVQGRVRFNVAHDASRPFVVLAKGGSVTALGTVFDVAVDAGTVSVHLLQGSVEVAQPTGMGTPRRIRLSPGNITRYGQDDADAGGTAPHSDNPGWPQGRLTGENIPLSTIIAEANRYSATAIRLSEPDLGGRKVSGTFDVRDTERLIARLARLLDLPVKRKAGVIILG